jgi:hypothetical protein
MLYKGGMCLGSVVTYLMFVPKAVPHAGCQKLNLGSNFTARLFPGDAKFPRVTVDPGLGQPGTRNTVHYCRLK